jgi:hypothetical protein
MKSNQNVTKAPSRTLLTERWNEVQEKAASKTTTVTLRIPTELNDWLDQYRHLSYPQRIEKQSLVIEALKLLYLARGKPGTEVYALDQLLLAPGSGRKTKKEPR